MFSPTKSDALEALQRFIPYAGEDYAKNRNYDLGDQSTVSKLAPWVRNRLLTEWEIIETVLATHSVRAASKFIDEVCWRTYWKGWLQLRPQVWENYQDSLRPLLEGANRNPDYKKAIEGRTGIDCFDYWARELVENHYLHNHARMWYASIWIHTLKLPWELGADWFLRHLLDGDPASNTLSWRWVAGLHTRGKTYLATRENIQKYTGGRFSVDSELAHKPITLPEETKPKPRQVEQLPAIPRDQNLGLLVIDDDLSIIDHLPLDFKFATMAGLALTPIYRELEHASEVIRFRKEALESTRIPVLGGADQVLDWIKTNQLSGIVLCEPSVGPAAQAIQSIQADMHASVIPIYMIRNWWDTHFFPHATHGFFRFKKAIPSAIERLLITQIQEVEL